MTRHQPECAARHRCAEGASAFLTGSSAPRVRSSAAFIYPIELQVTIPHGIGLALYTNCLRRAVAATQGESGQRSGLGEVTATTKKKVTRVLVAAMLVVGLSSTADANDVPRTYTEVVDPSPDGGKLMIAESRLETRGYPRTAVPEPGTLALLAIGLIGMGVALSRHRSQK